MRFATVGRVEVVVCFQVTALSFLKRLSGGGIWTWPTLIIKNTTVHGSASSTLGANTMRRFSLVLTVFSLAAWCQPAQQQGQQPIVVQIQTPPENIWMSLLKVAVPTLLGAGLGAGITLYGLRQTNKHNAFENAANREHQLRVEIAKAEIAATYKSQGNRWEFRKDVYSTLITANHDVLKSLHAFARAAKLKTDPNEGLRKLALTIVKDTKPQFAAGIKTLTTYAALAPLATADDVLPILTAASGEGFQQVNFDSPDVAAQIQSQLNALGDMLKRLQAAGRKDLWGTLVADKEEV
jgi:hypothetical protein